MSQPTIGSQAQYRDLVTQAIESYREELVGVSLEIHAHPELNYEERHAAALLADNLEGHGFAVERGKRRIYGAVEGLSASTTRPMIKVLLATESRRHGVIY